MRGGHQAEGFVENRPIAPASNLPNVGVYYRATAKCDG